MSWSFTVQYTDREKFQEALDNALIVVDAGVDPGIDKQVNAAKKAIKDLVKHVKRNKITATATGHVWSESDGAHWHDGVSVYVSGAE